MNDEPVEFFALSEEMKIKLRDGAMVFAENVLGDQTSLKTASSLRNSHREEIEYLERLRNLPAPLSCLELLKQQSRKLRTGSEGLDKITGGGIKLKSVTEICGLPGSGKTQLCIQLSAMSQLPETAGGVSGRTVFVDSNFGFTLHRYTEIRDTLSLRIPTSCNWRRDLEPLAVRVRSAKELLSALQVLRKTLEKDKNIKLVIFDSFSRPLLSHQVSTTLMPIMLTDLHALASDFNIAIVLTSQMTSKYSSESAMKYQSVLRAGYSYYVNDRILLQVSNEELLASCSKNLDSSEHAEKIKIKKGGII